MEFFWVNFRILSSEAWGPFIEVEICLRIRHGVSLKHKLRLLCLQFEIWFKNVFGPLLNSLAKWNVWWFIEGILPCFWCIGEVFSEKNGIHKSHGHKARFWGFWQKELFTFDPFVVWNLGNAWIPCIMRCWSC